MAITNQRITGTLTLTNGVEYKNFELSAPTDRNILYSMEAWELVAVRYTSSVAGSDGSAVTLMLEKCSSTTAPGSGTDLLSATIDLKTTAHNTATGALVTTASTLLFAAGDRLAIDVTGTPTAVLGTLTIGYQKVG